MAKFIAETHSDEVYVRYQCPGCKHDHCVPAGQWKWNGDLDKPTLSPSVRHYYTVVDNDTSSKVGSTKRIITCHYHIKDGMIAYCDDCEHKLKGQTIELPDIEEST